MIPVKGGDLIAIARRRAGVSQRALAARLGVPQSTVARWEAGDHEPSVVTLERALSACGLALMLGIANADDSYRHQISEQLALAPSKRVERLGRGLPIAPADIARALAAEGVDYVLAGEIAGAARGWPVTLDNGEFLVVPDEEAESLEAVERAAATLGGGGRELDDPFGGFDARWVWSLPGGQQLVASVEPAGARGYRDLLRDAEAIALGGAPVLVASLRDLIRLADASPRERERAFTPALWATLDQTRGADRKAASTRAAHVIPVGRQSLTHSAATRSST
jgi:transcriptional regulator with XRE-family HTH domain